MRCVVVAMLLLTACAASQPRDLPRREQLVQRRGLMSDRLLLGVGGVVLGVGILAGGAYIVQKPFECHEDDCTGQGIGNAMGKILIGALAVIASAPALVGGVMEISRNQREIDRIDAELRDLRSPATTSESRAARFGEAAH